MRWEEGESLWPCPSRQPVSELPTTPSPDSDSVGGILVPQVHCGWWWGTVFGSWNKPEFKAAIHTPVPDSEHCSLGRADSLELGERKP